MYDRRWLATAALGLAAPLLQGCYLSHEPLDDPPNVVVDEPGCAPPATDAGACRLPAEEPPSSVARWCGFVDGDASDHPTPFLVFSDRRVLGVDAAGIPRILHRFEADPCWGERRFRAHALEARGRYAAAVVEWASMGESGTTVVDVVLIDLGRGEVIARYVEQMPWEPRGGRLSLRGNRDGLFVFSVGTTAASRTGVISPSWTGALPIDTYSVEVDPTGDGVIGVRIVDSPGGAGWYWLDLCSLESRPAGAAVHSVVGERALVGAVRSWRIETADEEGPFFEGSFRGNPPRISSSRRVFLSVDDQAGFRSYGLSEGEVTTFRMQAPPGLRLMPEAEELDPMMLYGAGWAGPTSDGALLVAFRDDERAYMYRTLDGAAWEAVGEAVGEVGAFGATDVEGTYFLIARDRLDDGAWAPGAPDRIDGRSVQIRRPATGFSRVYADRNELPNHYHVSMDGRCVAWLGRGGMRFLSAETGAERVVDLSLLGELTYPVHTMWAEDSREVYGTP